MMRGMDAKAIDRKVSEYRKQLEESEARRAKAIEMDAAGKTVQEIGNALKVTRQRAAQILAAAKRALSRNDSRGTRGAR